MISLTEKRIISIWSKVQRVENGCWEWIAARSNQGYGRVKISGKPFAAHRVIYFIANGVDPGQLFVCHTCDNPPCCNPKHLFLGTRADNMRDAFSKGRIPFASRWREGELSPQAKLTHRQVREIRQLYANRKCTVQEFAACYGVTPGAIGHIVRGTTWNSLR